MNYDATIVGWCANFDGIGRHFCAFAEALSDTLNVNAALTFPIRKQSFPPAVQKVLQEKQDVAGRVSIFVDILWLPYSWFPGYQKIPEGSLIKIAYLVFEATQIPREWLEILHTHFDAVAVPDPFCVEVFKASGLTLPVFLLPLSADLNPFLSLPLKQKPGSPFIFGNTSVMNDRKNHDLLVKGFAAAFGNRNDVRLKLNCKGQEPDVLASIQKWLDETKTTNIELNLSRLSEDEYLNFMYSLDCYVNVAKGEGFAIPPREALALGIPCVLADNTAQQTLCRSGYVRPIVSQIREPAWIEIYLQYHGEWFNSKVEDVAAGLSDVYENYSFYLQKAQQGKEWVKHYLPENLKERYLNLVNPKKLILGDRDEVTDNYLMTASPDLYEKFLSIQGKAI